MKVALFILGTIFSFNAFSGNEAWALRFSDTSCSIFSHEFVDINDNQYIDFFLAFAVASESHNISESLSNIGLKPNEITLYMSVSLHNKATPLETEEPLQVMVNDKALVPIENEYGVIYYLPGSEVKKALDKIVTAKPFQFYVQSESLGKSIPIAVTDKGFMLSYHLLKSCAAYFV